MSLIADTCNTFFKEIIVFVGAFVEKTPEYDRQILACNCFDQIMTFLSFTIMKSAIDAKGPSFF
jgi:hypothetical protein